MSDSDTEQTAAKPDVSRQADKFTQQAEEPPTSLVAEFWDFVIHNKKWWIAPIVIVMLLVGILVFLAGTPIGPMIYPLG